MKVRLTTSRWDQQTPKGKVSRRRGDQFTVKDDVAEWLIRSGSAEPTGRQPAAAPREPDAGPSDVIEGLDDDAGDEADESVGDDGNAFDEDNDGDDEDDSEGVERPAQSAPKSAWVAYAVSRGIPEKEAEAMDKQRLISRTG